LYDSGLDDVRSVLEQLPASSWLAWIFAILRLARP
jgi:hypothetical protein